MVLYDIEIIKSNDATYPLSDLKGSVLLIVNTASKCRFTPQYEALEVLHQKYKDKGLIILAFPCNQFANQEPDTANNIEHFCQLNYGVSFELYKKVKVNGNDAAPIFRFLKSRAKGILGSESIKWNFTKFLVSRNGEKVIRFAPSVNPIKLGKQIDLLLSED